MRPTTRSAEVLQNNEWTKVAFENLKEGDVFRLFEEDGSDVDGGEICKATSAPFEDDDVITIKCEPVTPLIVDDVANEYR